MPCHGTGDSPGAPSHWHLPWPSLGHTGPIEALCGAVTTIAGPVWILGNKPHSCHQPDSLTNSLVQRLEGQLVLGDRNQQWLPIQHCPGRCAGWPGLPFPEVHWKRDTLRAVQGAAADLVPAPVNKRAASAAGPCEQRRLGWQ